MIGARNNRRTPCEQVERLLSGGAKEFVLQTSVSDLALLDKRKFGLRIHALVVAIGKV